MMQKWNKVLPRRPLGAVLAGLAVAQPSLSQQLLHEVFGGPNAQSFGAAVAGLGDLNKDGYDDFAVGDPLDQTAGLKGGRVVVYSGLDASELFTLDSPAEGLRFGEVIAAAGDVDMDGTPDFIVGAPRPNNIGEAFVFSGADGSMLLHLLGYYMDGLFGIAVAGAGDVDGDGHADVLVGSPQDKSDGFTFGKARVFSGIDGSLIYTLKGNASSDEFGFRVAAAGDVDADGAADFLIGAPSGSFQGADDGALHVISGASGLTLFEIHGPVSNAALGSVIAGVGDLNGDGYDDFAAGIRFLEEAWVFSGADGSVLFTVSELGGNFGSGIAGGGDANGDGLPDLLVGANFWDQTPNGDEGGMFLYSGDGTPLFFFAGAAAGDHAGGNLAFAGDVNGDGLDDLMSGAPPFGVSGHARVWAGDIGLCPPPTIYCLSASNSVGPGAKIGWQGSTSIGAADFAMTCTGLPSNTAGLFYYALSPPSTLGLFKFGNGWLCTEGPKFRFGVDVSDAAGTVTHPLDFASWPGDQIEAGTPVYFQYWYRDPQHFAPFFNTSDAMKASFCQ
jgi:FG-GAP repeat